MFRLAYLPLLPLSFFFCCASLQCMMQACHAALSELRAEDEKRRAAEAARQQASKRRRSQADIVTSSSGSSNDDDNDDDVYPPYNPNTPQPALDVGNSPSAHGRHKHKQDQREKSVKWFKDVEKQKGAGMAGNSTNSFAHWFHGVISRRVSCGCG